MGFNKNLGKAVQSCFKYLEKNASKIEAQHYKLEEKRAREEQQVMDYKSEYSSLDNDDLLKKLHDESGLKKKAAAYAIQERKCDIEHCKKVYSDLSSGSLRTELQHLRRSESFYDMKGYRKLTSEEVYVRENVINAILRSRGEM